jgi:SAM-dependent methyltransferase
LADRVAAILPAVTEVLPVEPENHLRTQAVASARRARVPITVVPGLADALPAENGAFDAAVCSLILCSVPDQAAALAELRRVLRPGAELHFYEHVAAEQQPLALMQRMVEPVWSRIGGGCHLTRHTGAALETAGFSIERIARFAFRPGLLATFSSPHILGIARTSSHKE